MRCLSVLLGVFLLAAPLQAETPRLHQKAGPRQEEAVFQQTLDLWLDAPGPWRLLALSLIHILRPDGKTQISIIYDEEHRPIAVDNVVVSAQHHPDVDQATIARDLYKHVIEPVIPRQLWTEETKVFVNPTGRFVVGGPKGDAGLTGRKIIVDTYGGCARHGGGAFSGKDPTKVDRSASYAARYVAKNIVAAGLAKRVELQLAYAIGVANPVSLHVDTFGTGVIPDREIEQLIRKHFDLRPAAIIRDLNLQRPIYRQVAAYGHFGRLDLDLPWERLDKVDVLKG